MIDSTEETRRMDNILNAFHDYIQAHTFFDIVHSEKIGYMRIQTEYPEEGDGLVVIRSVDTLLEILFTEVIYDVLFEDSERDDFTVLSKDDVKEIRRRITEILETLDSDQDYCLDFLDVCLKNSGSESEGRLIQLSVPPLSSSRGME